MAANESQVFNDFFCFVLFWRRMLKDDYDDDDQVDDDDGEGRLIVVFVC